MRKKRILHFIGILFAVILLIGCGDNNSSSVDSSNENEELHYVDEDFVQAMAQGLQTRWDLNNQDEQKEGYEDILVNSDEYKNMMINYIDAELDIIEEYKDGKFENSKLQEIAIKYINLLNEHKEICDYMTVDYEKYYEEFEPIYNERSKVINELVNNYGLTVDEEYQNILNDFLTNSQLVEEREVQEEAVEKMLKSIQFQEVSNEGEYKTYQAIVENTTGIDFKSFSVNINLLNDDAVIVETMYDSVSDFKNGAKVQFEFITDREFVSTNVTADWWE